MSFILNDCKISLVFYFEVFFLLFLIKYSFDVHKYYLIGYFLEPIILKKLQTDFLNRLKYSQKVCCCFSISVSYFLLFLKPSLYTDFLKWTNRKISLGLMQIYVDAVFRLVLTYQLCLQKIIFGVKTSR